MLVTLLIVLATVANHLHICHLLVVFFFLCCRFVWTKGRLQRHLSIVLCLFKVFFCSLPLFSASNWRKAKSSNVNSFVALFRVKSLFGPHCSPPPAGFMFIYSSFCFLQTRFASFPLFFASNWLESKSSKFHFAFEVAFPRFHLFSVSSWRDSKSS